MKVPFELRPNHRLILYILHGRRYALEFKDLSRALEALAAADDSNFDRFIDIVVGPYYVPFARSGYTPPVIRDIDGLEFIGLIQVKRLLEQPFEIELTEEGKRIAKSISENRRVIVRPQPSLRTSVFVACAFGYEEIDQLYSNNLAQACETLGYTPVRVDMNEPSQTITELMMDSVTEAACVIADLTHARPSVYFEVGYAHGLGVPLLLTCRKDHHRGKSDAARIHFDLEQYKISYWSRDSKGRFTWRKEMEPYKRLASILAPRKSEE